jgi:hypothetical protein
MLKVITEVAHPFLVAVTVATPTIGDAVVFDANVQPGILSVVPVPDANPNEAKFVTLQLQVVTGSAFVAKLIVLCTVAGQAIISVTCVITGVALMVKSKLSVTELQPSLVAMISIVPTMSDPVVLFGAVKMMSPLPLVAMPIDALSFVHAYVTPVKAGVVVIGILIDAPGQ